MVQMNAKPQTNEAFNSPAPAQTSATGQNTPQSSSRTGSAAATGFGTALRYKRWAKDHTHSCNVSISIQQDNARYVETNL